MSSPVTLLSFINGIVTDLKAVMAPFGVKADQVQTHYGRFDLTALQRFGAGAPAVRVAALNVLSVEPFEGQLNAKVRFGIFLITRDTTDKTTNKPIPRDVAMLGMVQAVIQRANTNGWGGDAGDQPTSLAADNLYADDSAAQGMLLWAVAFTQGINCDVTDASVLANFDIFTGAVDDPVTEKTGIDQTTDMPQ